MSSGKTGFYVVLASLPQYERLVAEIFCDGNFVAIVSQERNEGEFDFETPSEGLDESKILRKIDLAGLLEAVALACSRLAVGALPDSTNDTL